MTGNDIEEFMYGLFGYRVVEEKTLEESGFFSRLVNAISGDYELTRHGNQNEGRYRFLNGLLYSSILINRENANNGDFNYQYQKGI